MESNPLVPFIEPRLPQDLERIIFEIAAHDDRRAISTLVRVARRVRDWLDPLHYEIVIIKAMGVDDTDSTPLVGIEQFDFLSHPTGSQGKHVRHLLYVEYNANIIKPSWKDLVPQILGYHNIQSLGFWAVHHTATVVSDLTSILLSPLRTVPHGLLRLSANLPMIFPEWRVDFNHIILQDLTHLETESYEADFLTDWEEDNNFACLKKLKCLCFSGSPPSSNMILKCLDECKSLELLVILRESSSELEEVLNQVPRFRRKVDANGIVEEIPEDRVVFIDGLAGPVEWMEHWFNEVAARDPGNNIWARGESVLEQRRLNRKASISKSDT